MLPSLETAEALLREAEARMADVRRRYGYYPPRKWAKNLELMAYFAKKAGRDIYEVVEKDTFHP